MIRKIFISFLLLATFNFLVGCYTGEQISNQELRINEDKIVVAPSKWFNIAYKPATEWKDIYCKGWHII